ncbi:MAG: AfsR/SARP family transcriptional regulator, partial [Streptomyces sp.]
MRYLILGASEARDEHGRPVHLGGPRLRALFAALAWHADAATPVPVDQLINKVWTGEEGRPPDDAPAALQALIGRLRRVLGREAVESLPGGYRLRAEPDDVDLHRFRRLAREGASAAAALVPARRAGALRAVPGRELPARGPRTPG